MEITKEYLHQKYIIENLTIKQIAKLTGLTESTVFYKCKRLGFSKKDKMFGQETFKNKEWLLEYYIEKNLNTKQIAEIAGVFHSTIDKYLGIHKIRKAPERYEDGLNTKERLKKVRYSFKIKMLEYKGRKCEICGYSKCINALEFHHSNPDNKDFPLARFCLKVHPHNFEIRFEEVKIELDKCSLLCANCHREQHSEVSSSEKV